MFKILCSDVIEFPTDFKTQMPKAQFTSPRDFGFLQNKGSLRISLMFHVPNQGLEGVVSIFRDSGGFMTEVAFLVYSKRPVVPFSKESCEYRTIGF